MFRTCIVLAALGACAATCAERAVVECVADTWIARGDREAHGRERALKVTARGAALLRFRTEKIAGWRVNQAVLLLHIASGKAPARIRVAQAKSLFAEGEATWDNADHPSGKWRRVRTFEENWIAIDLAPGETTAHALVLSGADAQFDARETAGFAPYLLVEGSKAPAPR